MNTPHNELTPSRNVLLVGADSPHADAIQVLANDFFGTVLPTNTTEDLTRHTVYACGDLSELDRPGVQVVRELSTHSPHGHALITQGQVPLDVHGLGVLYPRMFERDLFAQIQAAHAFQNLTESTKPSLALRRGIYLTEVTREAGPEEVLNFRLLRCSSNLTGPTDNLRSPDRHVLDVLNEAGKRVFDSEPALNHVLAQIYDNRREGGKERKAKIGAHSDKTKDMGPHAVMAFCTFYDQAELAPLTPSPTDPYDRVHRKQSGLTRLHFKRKKTVDDPALIKEFTVTLYPNSVLFIPLSTNRLYTHAIRPGALPPERLPTRMGYVVRCSGQEAVFKEGRTYLRDGDTLHALQPMDVPGVQRLRDTYREENSTDDRVRYGSVPFSMNAGDYQRPLL